MLMQLWGCGAKVLHFPKRLLRGWRLSVLFFLRAVFAFSNGLKARTFFYSYFGIFSYTKIIKNVP